MYLLHNYIQVIFIYIYSYIIFLRMACQYRRTNFTHVFVVQILNDLKILTINQGCVYLPQFDSD